MLTDQALENLHALVEAVSPRVLSCTVPPVQGGVTPLERTDELPPLQLEAKGGASEFERNRNEVIVPIVSPSGGTLRGQAVGRVASNVVRSASRHG